MIDLLLPVFNLILLAIVMILFQYETRCLRRMHRDESYEIYRRISVLENEQIYCGREQSLRSKNKKRKNK